MSATGDAVTMVLAQRLFKITRVKVLTPEWEEKREESLSRTSSISIVSVPVQSFYVIGEYDIRPLLKVSSKSRQPWPSRLILNYVSE